MLVEIREATVGDAQAIATIHVDSWQAAYRGILPDAYLANLTVVQRSEAWRKSIREAEARSALAGILTSRHFCLLAPRDSDPHHAAFAERESARRTPHEAASSSNGRGRNRSPSRPSPNCTASGST